MYGALAIGTFVFYFVVGSDMNLIGTHMQQSVRGGISDGISFSEAVVTICLTFCTDSSNQRMFVSDSSVMALTHFAFSFANNRGKSTMVSHRSCLSILVC